MKHFPGMLLSGPMKFRPFFASLAILALCSGGAAGAPAKAAAKAAANPAEAFLMAKESIRVGDAGKLARLAPQLKGYPLEPYLEYWQVGYRLQERSVEDIRGFLERNEETLLAEQLRADWLKLLGKKGDWEAFREQRARLLNEDAEIACYALLDRSREGGVDSVAEDLKAFWLAPRDLPEGCAPVAQQLLNSGRYSSGEVWQRFRVLADAGRVRAAKKLLESLSRAEAPVARSLDQAFDSPARYLQQLPKTLSSRASHELVVLAFTRIARNDPQFAAARFNDALRAGPVREAFSAEERAYVWGQIAAAAARRHMPEAVAWFAQAEDAALSDDQLAWRVRIALRTSAWSQALAAIERMSPMSRADPAWIYWKARAVKALGRGEEAQDLFARIAGQHHYYGRLAAEELGQPMELPPAAAAPTPEELAQAGALPGLQRALALFALGMRNEGVREWNWTLRGMDDRRLLAAAQLASDNEIWDRSISTADRTIALHDFSLRYPAPHREIFAEQARVRSLDETWVLGLVRQESRFVASARSSAGAAGLMQIMPSTARWVAHRLGLKNFSTAKVVSIDTNAALGTYYLRRVLDDMDGQPVLAAAAYNAGPSRARNWLDPSPMEGAIYVESIPFGETRDYVKKVMTNALYYAAVLGGKRVSLKERLGQVSPRSTIAANDTP